MVTPDNLSKIREFEKLPFLPFFRIESNKGIFSEILIKSTGFLIVTKSASYVNSSCNSFRPLLFSSKPFLVLIGF